MSGSLEGQTLLNQFRIDAFVAAGGMGTVYRVWDLKRSVSLAMKVLHIDHAEDPSIFKLFKREARALEKLAHPNIVPFYGLHQTASLTFLLEGYVDGPSLKQILRRRKGEVLPIAEVLSYFKALTAALGYAHEHHIVHCDVKPGNVMIDQGGSVYLTDFGIARHAESTTTTLGFAGTPTYMAPEQIRGEPVTAATDVYALGILLFELLTGQRPYSGDENGSDSERTTRAERIRSAHLTAAPPDPRSINPELPEALSQILLKALAKDPQDRYQSGRELYMAVCEALGVSQEQVTDRVVPPVWYASPLPAQAAPPVQPVPVPVPVSAPQPLKRLPIWFWSLPVIIVIGVLFLGFFPGRSNLFNPAPGAAPTSTLSPTPLPPTAVPRTLTPSLTPLPTATPTQTPTPTPTLVPIFDWRFEVVLKNQEVGVFTNLAIDDQGITHIGFFQDNADKVHYAENASGDWLYELVVGGEGRGFHLDMELDSDGQPQFAYHIAGRSYAPRVYYAQWSADGWIPYRIGFAEAANTDVSLALGPDDSPHVIYQELYDNWVKYATFGSSGWDVQPVDVGDGNCRSFPLVVDKDGIPHLTYCAASGGLNYAKLAGQIWQKQTVDGGNGAGLFSDLVLDSQSQPHIAYYDSSEGSLRYALLNQSSWEIQIVDNSGDVGEYPSIALDGKGQVHISYYDATNSDLKYAHGRAGEWNIYTVDSIGSVGAWTSLALDPNGIPWISYQDIRNEDLKLAEALPVAGSTSNSSP